MTTVASYPITAHHRVRRAAAVFGAAAVNAVLWGVASAFGVDFVLSDSVNTAVITLPVAVIATAVFGLLGWGTLALLERFTRRARAVWVGLAVAVAALSIVPIFLEQATAGTQIALTVLHLVVPAVLIPGFRSPSPAGRR